LRDLPHVVYKQVEETYEHLDLIWAKTAHNRIFPKILELVKENERERGSSSLQNENSSFASEEEI